MENLFLKIRMSLLEGFILTTDDSKNRYFELIDKLKQDVIESSESLNTESLLNFLEQHRLMIEKIEPLKS